MFYKLQSKSPTYDEDFKLYKYHVGLVQDLMLKLLVLQIISVMQFVILLIPLIVR